MKNAFTLATLAVATIGLAACGGSGSTQNTADTVALNADEGTVDENLTAIDNFDAGNLSAGEDNLSATAGGNTALANGL